MREHANSKFPDFRLRNRHDRYTSFETISRWHLMTTWRLPKSCVGGHGVRCGGVQSYEPSP